MFINNLKTVFDNKSVLKTFGELWEYKKPQKSFLLRSKTNKLTKINIYPVPNPYVTVFVENLHVDLINFLIKMKANKENKTMI